MLCRVDYFQHENNLLQKRKSTTIRCSKKSWNRKRKPHELFLHCGLYNMYRNKNVFVKVKMHSRLAFLHSESYCHAYAVDVGSAASTRRWYNGIETLRVKGFLLFHDAHLLNAVTVWSVFCLCSIHCTSFTKLDFIYINHFSSESRLNVWTYIEIKLIELKARMETPKK